MRTKSFKASSTKSLLAASAFLLASGVAFAQSSVTLTAAPTSTTLPDGQSVPMWGYACGPVGGTGVSCTAANGSAQIGGVWQPPLITVPAGQPLTITLINSLSFSTGTGTNNLETSLVIVGQLGGGLGLAPTRTPSPTHSPQGLTWPAAGGTGPDDTVFTPPSQPDRVRSFATEVAAGGSAGLSWTAANLQPGTYLIHSGTHPSIQSPMGLYGVLVVTDPTYPGVAFDKDVALLLSEIDPVQNRAVDAAVRTAGFSTTKVWNGATGECGDPTSAQANTCYPPAVNYTPLYYLINGMSFDRTNASGSALSVPGAAAQGRVLLRFVNAGLRMHVPSVVGLNMSLYAEDGNKLPGLAKVQNQVFLAAGKTYDVTIQPAQASPATNPATYAAASYAIFDRALALSTNNQRDGGMQVYLQVAGGALPAAGLTVSASGENYYCVAGTTLDVTDPSRGVLANDRGANGAVLGTVSLLSGSLTFQPNGTFTYTQLPTDTTCGGTFTYLVNGNAANTATATITQCDATNTAGCGAALGAAPIAAADSFSGSVATRLQVSPPGVLVNDVDPSGLPLSAVLDACTAAPGFTCLTAAQLALNSDGSFTANTPGAGNYMFQYHAVNTQKRVSASVTVSITAPTPNAPLVAVKDAKTGLAISDYRWIIEEDRTFFSDPACQVNSTNPALRPASCPPLPIQNLGTNFHTSHMPVVAMGCVGSVSCESGQTVGGTAAVCDIGNGACRTDAAQKTPLDPSQVHLDSTKRYFISVLPGDGVNPTLGGAGTPQQVDPTCDPTVTTCAMRQFDIAKDCGTYDPSIGSKWEAGGANALCGHGMGGAQIAAGQTAPVNVSLQQTPLTTAKISVVVFQDDSPLNGEQDSGGGVDILAPNEPGLAGFEIKLLDQAGGFGDSTGQPTYDMFNQPLSNALAGTLDPATGLDACPISKRKDGLVGMIPTCPKFESDGKTLSPLAGQALIANLYPGLYEVVAAPGADRIARGEEWLQTNTLDGTKSHEAFIKPGEPGYFQEFGPGGYHVAIGFANPAIINARKGTTGDGKQLVCSNQTCTATLNGLVTNARMSRTPDQRVYSSGSYDSYSFTNCYASMGAPDGADFAFAKCDANGRFTFSGIPTGNFKVTVFDQWNDLLVDGLSTPVKVDGSTVNVEIPVTQWRTNLYTRTFIDLNGDGVSQPDEPGLPLVATNVRYRDGSYGFFNNTDLNGNAGFNEVFPFLNWLVVETDTTRYKPTGVHVVYDAGGPVDGTPGGGSSTIAAAFANTTESATAHLPPNLRVPGAVYCDNADCTGFSIQNGPATSAANPSTGRIDPPWAGTQGWQGLLGQNSFIEWGMKPYAPGETGGIKGHVFYTSTRPFDDPTLLLQLSWLPGVPHVTVNLYKVGTAPDGSRSLKLVDTTATSSWDDWAQGFRSDGVSNMNCPGQETSSPFYSTLADTKQWLNQGTVIPEHSRFKCYDGWSMLNQVQPAPYDGMYKFPSVTGRDPVTGKPTSTNCTGCVPNATAAPTDYDYNAPMLPAGRYVVEVILPAGYELVKEEDKNILLGDVYIAPVTQQFLGFGNIFIMPDQAAVNAHYNRNNPGNLNRTTNLGAVPRHEGDTGSVESFWPCVGAMRIVPDYMSLFPGSGQNAPFAGALRPLCDRKEVILEDQASVLAKFYVFSSTHVAGHYTGSITNDFASEFDPFSPQFGEKFAPPNMPVAFKDFAGNEVARTYSDQWGMFNGLYFSSWEVNPPNPTGYAPQMAIACMNDPGPIPDPAHPGQTMIDPMYNPAFSNFCYETPFMPGQTQYMDTPVIPTMAFAEGYNLPDCEYPDGTPAIASVLGDAIPGGGNGPWVSTNGHTLTINAFGNKPVLNHAFSGPRASTAPFNLKFITRHYGFGTRCTATSSTCAAVSSVTIGGVPAPITSWSDTQIQVSVPAGVPTCALQQFGVVATPTQCGQLAITAGNGKSSIDTATITIGGKTPTYVSGPNGDNTALQVAINNAVPGDMIIVGPGTYRENVLMWKPVRLQGVGAASVTINADAHPSEKMQAWRRQVNCMFGLALNGQPISASNPYDATNQYPCDPKMQQRVDRIPFEAIVGWDTAGNGNLAQLLQEPTLMGAYEGAGITVLGRGVRIPPNSTDFWGATAAGGFPAGYEYLLGGMVECVLADLLKDAFPGRDYFTSNFGCNPSRIDAISVTNSSQGGGAIFAHAWNHNLEISNTRVYANHGTLTGGITIGNGEFPDPFIAGDAVPNPFPTPSGTPAGTQLGYGFNRNVRVHHNSVTSNASIGDALFSGTPSAAGGVTFCVGADNYQFNYNWVCGNLSTGDGGGVAHAGFINDGTISHNTIIFNQSSNPTIPTHGGGLGILAASPDRTLPNGLECGNTASDADCPPGLAEGTGRNLLIDANLIMGNSAESGSGGGLRLQGVNGQEIVAFPGTPANWYEVTITNNIIANNVAGWDGAGVSMRDALKVKFINNTVISNDTTGSAGVLFNTLGAPMAAVPPPGCNPQPDPTLPQDPSCTSVNEPSTNQPAGLVTQKHTPNLIAALPASGVNCPGGSYNYSAGSCRRVSLPQLTNNMFWHNRAFHIEVGGFGSGLQSQQHLVGLVPALNQTVTGFCAATGVNMTGATVPVTYWDLGVQGDTTPTPNSGSGFRLSPSFSIVTNSGAYPGANNLGSDPLVVSLYCNGSRLPPENGGHGYAVPPGRSETTGLSPVFTLNNITVAATVDEGNNWINLSYGPLALNNPSITSGGTGYGVPLGNYAPASISSPAVNSATATGAPNHDFFGTPRPQAGGFDIGAVELIAPHPILTVSPASLAYGNTSINTTRTLQATVSNGAAATGNLVLATPTITAGTTGTSSPSKYSFTTTCPIGGTGLAPGAPACTISVTFAPTAVTLPTAQTATLNVNASNAATVTVALTGTGVLPTYTLTPGPGVGHNFGNQAVGTQSAPFTFTVTNTTAGGELWLTGNPVDAGTFANQFVASFTGGTCTASTHLASTQSCTFTVRFAPTTAGAKGTGVLNPGARVGVTTAPGAVNTGVLNSPVWGSGI